MKFRLPAISASSLGCALALILAPAAHAQYQNFNRPPGAGPGFGAPGGMQNAALEIKAINLSTPTSPDFELQNGETKRYTPGRWLEIEVEFSASAPAHELQFHYNVLLAGTLLVGDVTHVDVPAGQSLFSVMYVPPRGLNVALRGQQVNSSNVQNIDVQILRPGMAAPLADKMLRPGPAFYQTMQQVTGVLLNKTQTPFAPLWWDRYEAVKPPGGPQ
jgi:hypothetical protein